MMIRMNCNVLRQQHSIYNKGLNHKATTAAAGALFTLSLERVLIPASNRDMSHMYRCDMTSHMLDFFI